MVSSSRSSSKSQSQDGTRPVVLVADDYAENRRLLYFYLRERYDVLQASTAEEALSVLRESKVDAIILDLNFRDGMSGIEAIGHIRREPGLAGVRALALTAYAYPDDRQRCLDAGFDAYLAKPVFKPAILEMLSEMLSPDAGGAGSGGEVSDVWVSRKREEG
jgi:CheY-like chemotaxis protein